MNECKPLNGGLDGGDVQEGAVQYLDPAGESDASHVVLIEVHVELDTPFTARVVQRRDPSVQPCDPMQEAGAPYLQRLFPFQLNCRLLL